uniref:Uncharacterized protein n=1 Tax=Oryza glumipatula TaxID=40148 RepID=A0A0D9YLE7_9ORYZ
MVSLIYSFTHSFIPHGTVRIISVRSQRSRSLLPPTSPLPRGPDRDPPPTSLAVAIIARFSPLPNRSLPRKPPPSPPSSTAADPPTPTPTPPPSTAADPPTPPPLTAADPRHRISRLAATDPHRRLALNPIQSPSSHPSSSRIPVDAIWTSPPPIPAAGSASADPHRRRRQRLPAGLRRALPPTTGAAIHPCTPEALPSPDSVQEQ